MMRRFFSASVEYSVPGSKPHHVAGGFRNNYVDMKLKSLWDVLKWQTQRFNLRVGAPPRRREFDSSVVEQQGPWVTWVGHATALVRFSGMTLLTDPMFSACASPLPIGPKRFCEASPSIAQLPHIDLVLISHNHYDHLDVASVQQLSMQQRGSPLFVVPLGMAGWFRAQSINNVIELDWYSSAIRCVSPRALVAHAEIASGGIRIVWAHWRFSSLQFNIGAHARSTIA
jgi:N-acyl-phosphatidylethanolamine-hydrolysing phospholipase D